MLLDELSGWAEVGQAPGALASTPGRVLAAQGQHRQLGDPGACARARCAGVPGLDIVQEKVGRPLGRIPGLQRLQPTEDNYKINSSLRNIHAG